MYIYIYTHMNMAELNQKRRTVHPGLFYLLDILVGDVVRLNGGQWSEHVSLGTKKGAHAVVSCMDLNGNSSRTVSQWTFMGVNR
jgi:hypothetical protein